MCLTPFSGNTCIFQLYGEMFEILLLFCGEKQNKTHLLSGSATQVKVNPSLQPILIQFDFDISTKKYKCIYIYIYPFSHLKMWRVGGKVVAGTFSPRPWPSASQQRLRVSSLPWVTVAPLQPPLTLPPPPAQPPVASRRLRLQSPTPKSPPCDLPSPPAEQPSLLPCSTSFTTPPLQSITTCYLHS